MSIQRRTRKRDRRVVYDVRLRGPDGQQYWKTFATKREAEAFEASQKAELDRDTWVDPRRGDVSFQKVAQEWLESNPAKRPSSWERDEAIIRLHLNPKIGRAKVQSITPALVQRLVNQWSAAMAANTARRNYCTLRAVLNYAVSAEYIGRSPCRSIKLPRPLPSETHIVTAEELERLAQAAGPRYAAMVYVAGVLGLRWGECAGLKVGRLDFSNDTIRVDEQLAPAGRGRRAPGPPKTQAGVRTMAVPHALMALLAAHLGANGIAPGKVDALVFASPEGRPLSYSAFRERVWNPACVAVGLGRWLSDPPNNRVRRRYEGLTFHDLRDASSTAMVTAGIDVKTAQVRLGHADVRTTLALYTRATENSDQAAARALDAHFLAGQRQEGSGRTLGRS